VRAQTRHQLKQDRFAETTMETVSWAVEHRKTLTLVGGIAAAIALIVIGAWYYFDQQDQKASMEMSHALRTYNAQIVPAGTPAQQGVITFTAPGDRARAAQKEFREIASKYSHTRSGEIARYFAASTDLELGNTAAAMKELKDIAGARNSDLAALAKLGLASAYHANGQDSEAIATYKDLISHPTQSVSKTTAELQLADLYSAKQPAEARKIYEQIRKDDPAGSAAQVAANKLQQLK
jgi:predicted negative regulator of RcsB-dependent stress response